MGPERAAVMMDLLPPVGWADIATKADLDAVRLDLKSDMKLLEGTMEHAFGRMQKNIYLSMLASNATVVGLVLAVMQIR